MDEASFAQLYKSVHLRRFFWAEARRLFARDEAAQKDSVQEAWLRISAQPAGQSFGDYKKHGAKAIKAAYMRLWRRRGNEGPADLEEPGEALRALTKKAIDGDW